MKLKLLINVKVVRIKGSSCQKQLSMKFILLINVKMPAMVPKFNIDEQDKYIYSAHEC